MTGGCSRPGIRTTSCRRRRGRSWTCWRSTGRREPGQGHRQRHGGPAAGRRSPINPVPVNPGPAPGPTPVAPSASRQGRPEMAREYAQARLDQPRGRRQVSLKPSFDPDAFGRVSETIARFFGTARYLVIQTVMVIVWIALNILVITKAIRWDPYPFILLNLAFSTQAAYAAPLILLAQNRQAERDKVQVAEDRRVDVGDQDARVRLAGRNERLLDAGVDLQTAGGEPAAATRGQDRRLRQLGHAQDSDVVGARDVLGPLRDRHLRVVQC